MSEQESSICVLCPSRGLTFTRTEIFIDQIREKFNTKIIRTYDKKIPEAHNWLVQEALKSKAEFFLFLEEDMVPSIQGISELVKQDTDIAFIDYGVNGYSCSARDKSGKILWAGLGCTLVKRKVFEKLDKPWFRTDKVLRLNDMKWLDQEAKYGGQDIWFYTQAREAGFKIVQVPGEAVHLGIKELGKSEVNNGLHPVFEKSKIKNLQII